MQSKSTIQTGTLLKRIMHFSVSTKIITQCACLSRQFIHSKECALHTNCELTLLIKIN